MKSVWKLYQQLLLCPHQWMYTACHIRGTTVVCELGTAFPRSIQPCRYTAYRRGSYISYWYEHASQDV